jgi:hypothetical protein
MALIGKIVGGVTFGANTVSSATGIPYIAAVDAKDGTRLWANGYNLGANGLFKAIAANPNSAAGRIAVCGTSSSAATQLVPGVVYGGGASDGIIAVFDANGTKLWAAELTGAGLDTCAGVSVDDNGDVVATGQFDSATLTLPSGVTLTGPGTSTRKFMWVAKFAGGTGATIAASVFSGTSGNANPLAITTSAAGEVVVSGSFSANLTIGAAMTSAGSDDVFVAKLDVSGSSFVPAWNAVRFGGTGTDIAKSIALTSYGDIVVAGTVNPASATFKSANGGFDTNGAIQLTVNGTGAPDMFIVKLNGLTGATDGGTTYGDAITQNGDAVVVNRFSSANQVTFGGMVSGSATFGVGGTVTAVNASDVGLVFGDLEATLQ